MDIAGWSSSVARRAHNEPTFATKFESAQLNNSVFRGVEQFGSSSGS